MKVDKAKGNVKQQGQTLFELVYILSLCSSLANSVQQRPSLFQNPKTVGRN